MFFDNNAKRKESKMKIHKKLDYEVKMRNDYNEFVPKLNKTIYTIKKYVGGFKDWEEIERKMMTGMYPPKLNFSHLTKYEMELVKGALNIRTAKKHTGEYGATLTAILDNGVTVIFNFDLPDSCEVVKEISWSEVDESEYKVNGDGTVLRKREVVVGVNCGDDSMINSLFGGTE